MLRGGKRHLEWKRPAWYVFYSFVNTLHCNCLRNNWVILMKGWHTDWVTRAVFISSAFTIKDQQVQVTPCVTPVINASVTFSNKALFRIFSFQGWLQPSRPHETVKVQIHCEDMCIDLWDPNRGVADSFKFLQSRANQTTTLILSLLLHWSRSQTVKRKLKELLLKEDTGKTFVSLITIK